METTTQTSTNSLCRDSELKVLTLKPEKAQPFDTLKIGIDVSVDSTGLALVYGNKVAGFLFQPSLPPEDDSCPDLNYVQYNKIYSHVSNSAKEYTKMMTMRTLANKVNDAISLFMEHIYPNYPQRVQICVEGAAYGYMQHNSSSLVELVMFRAVIQDHVYHRWPLGTPISFDVLAPKAVKKEFAGDGKASKLQMIEEALTHYISITFLGKLDDFVDAYALATSKMLANPEPRLW